MKIVSVLGTINNGGFGIIEKVMCDNGNTYARKTFSPSSQFLSDKELCKRLRDRFRREVMIQKALPAEYFIPIVYHEFDDENPWFLMPIADEIYVDEIKKSKTEGRNPEGLGDILNSLEFIHTKGLVHRDLKPQNILKHEGTWKLADFGLITQDKEILSQTITTSNNAFGTTYYCAPEQTTDFRRVNHLADIYSFGAILHDIFTDGHRVPYSELSTHGEIGVIIEKCTKHKREHRFENVKSLRNKLLYVLSKKKAINLSEQNQEWIDNFKKTKTWNIDLFENFIFYLKRNEDIQHVFFYEITTDILDDLYNIDTDLFNEFCAIYFDWVFNTNFQFDYCDVVIGYVKNIYERINDLEIKTKATIAAAELANSHNRWYVMRKVISMADKDINENLAFRIGLEIEINNRNRENFKRCVIGVNQTKASYHQTIEDIL